MLLKEHSLAVGVPLLDCITFVWNSYHMQQQSNYLYTSTASSVPSSLVIKHPP